MSRPRLVLVAEDEPIASMALRAQLEALGYDVLGPARNGDDALVLGSCFPVELAVFDQAMPGRTGLEAADELFRLEPTPVVLLTGYSGADLPDPIPRPPIFGGLTKPVDLADLRASLNDARDAFVEWVDQDQDRQERVESSRDRRGTIARAVGLEAQGGPLLQAAERLQERARDQGRPLVEVARALLDRS